MTGISCPELIRHYFKDPDTLCNFSYNIVCSKIFWGCQTCNLLYTNVAKVELDSTSATDVRDIAKKLHRVSGPYLEMYFILMPLPGCR